MINIAVIGCGYWGPNLIRNFVASPFTNLLYTCDLDEIRLEKVLRPYPAVTKTKDIKAILNDSNVDGVAIATPVHTHYQIAKICLQAGKHVLIEKPLSSDISQGKDLVKLAKENNLKLMCDHTFCYTGAVRKIKEVITSGELGELLYFDSVRINLGLFQHDVNVVWDLAPHDLSILNYLTDDKPVTVSAHGISHTKNHMENIAYITIGYANSFLAHIHVNWLSPVKIRKTIICGDEKMLVWDDLEQGEKIKIFDKGIDVKEGDREQKRKVLISYRSADMHVPRIDNTEALSLVIKEFAESIIENRDPVTDGASGLQILRILDATDKSLKSHGSKVPIDYS